MVSAHKDQAELSLTAARRRARKINRTLAVMYPDAKAELDFQNNFQLLVAVVLSAQTTDVAVNKVTPELFFHYPSAIKLADAPAEHVAHIIKRTGFFNAKTKSIIGLAQHVVDRFDGEVPGTLSQLVSLPGVGRKTANVVLGNGFNTPGLTIDTHFGRLARRWGWSSSKDPVKVEADVAQLIERKEWTALSHRAIFHGRRICHSRTPACGACYLAPQCVSYGIGPTAYEKAEHLVKGPERDHLLALFASLPQ